MITSYTNLLPRILEIIGAFAPECNVKKECEMLEIIEELIEFAIKVILPHIRLVVEVCLCIGTRTDVAEEIQIKAIAVLGWLIRTKCKVSGF